MNAQFCQRCGSTLPEQEEGICPGCGTPFGARTVAMSVGAGDLLAAHEAKQRASALPSPTLLEAPAKGTSGTGSGAVALMVGVAGLVALLVVVIAFLLLRPA